MGRLGDIAARIVNAIAGSMPGEDEVSDLGKAIPSPSDKVEVGAFVDQIYTDGVDYFRTAFTLSKDSRFVQWQDPQSFWSAAQRLERGDHWSVWGHRNLGSDKWKQELVDDEIGDQIRARVAYLTANWHDVELSPNVAHINDVFDHERKKTEWSKQTRQIVRMMGVYGGASVRSVLDRSVDERGLARELIARPGSLVRTPYAMSYSEADGCWYFAHAQMVNQAWIRKSLPKFPLEEVTPTNSWSALKSNIPYDEDNQETKDYAWTKIYVFKEAFVDDPKLETIEFKQEEFDIRVAAILEGERVAPKFDDNHPKWLQAYRDWVEERLAVIQRTESTDPITNPEELKSLQAQFALIDDQIQQHIRLKDEYEVKTGLKAGKRRKYPFGRYIATIENVPAVDEPNPYEMPWRRLVRDVKNESIPYRIDGRSDVEILWNRNKVMDKALSRYADAALLAVYRKPWIKEMDKLAMDKHGGWVNDPTIPGIYIETAPVYPTPIQLSDGYLNLYGNFKSIAQRAMGISGVTYGQSPNKQASNELAETLLQQNEIIVTGEANNNLTDYVEDVVETRIEMWRRFYTEPRIYTINGKQKALIMSELLNNHPTEMPDGTVQPMPVIDIQVRVRPGSNFPNKWEKELNLLLSLSDKVDPSTGLPIVPVEMILDLLSQRFPSLGQGGEYRKMNEILALGMAVLKEQQKMAEEEEAVAGKVKSRVQNKQISELVGGENGS